MGWDEQTIINFGKESLSHYFSTATKVFPSWSKRQCATYLLWSLEETLGEKEKESLSLFGLPYFEEAFENAWVADAFLDERVFIELEDAMLHVADHIFSHLQLKEFDCRERINKIRKKGIGPLLEAYPELERFR